MGEIEVYEMTKDDFISEKFRNQIINIMQESEEVNYPYDRIPDDFGLKEYEKLRNYFEKGKANIILLISDNSILSYVWYFIKENRLHINEIATEKSSRGKGFGTRLLNYLINYAMDGNVGAIELFVLETNINAMNFYSKMGFISEKRLMRRDLLNGFKSNN